MTVSARTSLKKMSWARGQSSGWAAFDLKQRQKSNLESEVDKDPFPHIGTSASVQYGDKLVKKNHVPVKSFSSVLRPTTNFPALKGVGNCQMTMADSDSGGKYCQITAQEDVNLAVKKLKEQHLWAEESLIEDILAAVNNDVDMASTLLETMASEVNFKECKVSSDPGPTSSYDIPCDEKTDESLTLEKVKDGIPFHSNLFGHLKYNYVDLEDRNASSVQKLSDDDDWKFKMGPLNYVPVEPEWEEDDIYIGHRKDALKTMRSASRHSRAAANAFLKGDHISAQQHSMIAREEWRTAEGLNSKAATEILSIRNSENDIWRLDLHGLHATEAIQALQEHLNRIEVQGFSKSSATSNGNFMDKKILDNQQAPLKPRSLALHVITGIGNHSRGQAALPAAVRSFLNENRYRFEETRPGVIRVWPKYRQS